MKRELDDETSYLLLHFKIIEVFSRKTDRLAARESGHVELMSSSAFEIK